ncbi:MAG: hypothetical protein JSS84_01425 [Bacteroidetes bacterium]|nr:hypothetical protein [Bacteroidota bacterium]
MCISSGPAPRFGSYTLVCTALAKHGRGGMAPRWTASTSGPQHLAYRYRAVRAAIKPPLRQAGAAAEVLG